MRTFILWMEEEREVRDAIHSLCAGAGLARDALDNNRDVPLDIVDPNLLKKSIQNLSTIDPDKKEELLRLAQNIGGKHKGGSLRQIANLIKPDMIKRPDKKISQPAVLPPGQGQAPQPGQPNQQMQQPMQQQ
jgi:hypothetical protein